MFGTNHCEVASIQCCESTNTKSLSECHHGRIDCPERKVVVSAHELRDPYPIAREHRLGKQIAGGEITKESHFGRPAQTGFDEIGDFGDHELRHQQRTGVGLQQTQTRFMVAVVFVDVGV